MAHHSFDGFQTRQSQLLIKDLAKKINAAHGAGEEIVINLGFNPGTGEWSGFMATGIDVDGVEEPLPVGPIDDVDYDELHDLDKLEQGSYHIGDD